MGDGHRGGSDRYGPALSYVINALKEKRVESAQTYILTPYPKDNEIKKLIAWLRRQ